jgi:hypothetical protein
LVLSHLLGVDKYTVYNEFRRILKVGHFPQSNFHHIDLPSHNLKLIRVLVILELNDATFILRVKILSLIKVFKLAWTFIVEVGLVC